jgi:hypothetical protein
MKKKYIAIITIICLCSFCRGTNVDADSTTSSVESVSTLIKKAENLRPEVEFVPEESSWTYEECDGGVKVTGYHDENEKNVLPSAYFDSYDFDSDLTLPTFRVTIPETLNGKTVISIDLFRWDSVRPLTSIILPDTITTIESDAFDFLSDIENITLSSNLKSIGNGAFEECRNIETITIPDTVESIGDYAFEECSSLKNVTLPKGLERISRYMFYKCTSLETIEIPSTVEEIDSYAFYGCTSLKTITIPAKVSYIDDESSFADCRAMQKYVVDTANENYFTLDGMLCRNFTIYNYGEYDEETDSYPDYTERNGTYIIAYPGEKSGSFTLEKDMSFSPTAFLNALSLTAINVDSDNEDYMSIDGVVYTKNRDSGENYCVVCPAGKTGSVTIPDGIVGIQSNAFSCSKVSEVSLPDSVTWIGMYAFYQCSDLTSMKLPENLAEIGEYAFYQCSNLTSITIPDNVTDMYSNCLDDCSNLTSITIGKGVKYFPSLKNVSSIETILISSDNQNITAIDNVVYSKDKTELEYIPKSYKGKLTFPDELEFLSWDYYEKYYKGITEIYIGKNLKGVEVDNDDDDDDDDGGSSNKADKVVQYYMPSVNAMSLMQYTVSSENPYYTEKDGVLFSKDMKILYDYPAGKETTEYTVPTGVTSIEGAFDYCEKLKKLTIPKTVTDISYSEYDDDCSYTIYGYTGSAAETYAKKYNIPFVALDGSGSTSNGAFQLSSSSAYSISDSLLTGVKLNQNTVSAVTAQFTNANLVCVDAGGNQLSDSDKLGTGSKIRIVDGGTVQAECTVVIAGDVVGDGKIAGKDVNMLAQSCVAKTTLSDAQKTAADLDGDGKVTGKDVNILAQVCVGKKTISSQE